MLVEAAVGREEDELGKHGQGLLLDKVLLPWGKHKAARHARAGQLAGALQKGVKVG